MAAFSGRDPCISCQPIRELRKNGVPAHEQVFRPRDGRLRGTVIIATERFALGFGLASRMRSEQSDEQSAEQLQEVKHPKVRIAHPGICAIPDTIFGSHRH
jgi:hypothetical protein